jgi:hypothetical protein
MKGDGMKNCLLTWQLVVGMLLVVVTTSLGQTPPFLQCPPVGADTSCAVLVAFKPNGKPVVLTDPSQGPYDHIEDTLVGVQNNSNRTIFSISISSSAPIFGFDGDGICGIDPNTGQPFNPRPSGCPFGPTRYEGPGVTFSVQSGTSGMVNFAGGIPPGDSRYFSLEEANFTLNLCGDSSPPVVEQISGSGSCGPVGVKTPTWGSFGPASELVSDLGEKLQLRCDGGTNPVTGQPYLPSYHLYYTPPGGTPYRVGTCPFVEGCNNGWFSHSGRNPATGRPKCFVMIYWRSKDYGGNDVPNPWTQAGGVNTTAHEPVLDWAVTTFDVVTNNLTKKNYEYRYNPAVTPAIPPVPGCVAGPNRPEGALVRTVSLGDPPLGPDTEAFFNRVFLNLQAIAPPNAGPMADASVSLADLNADGVKDHRDFTIFLNAFASCEGSPRFDPSTDFDGDGCVTFVDYQIFLQLFNAN